MAASDICLHGMKLTANPCVLPPTPTPQPTPPIAVGGVEVSLSQEQTARSLESSESSYIDYGLVVTGVAVMAGVLTLSCTAWLVRRRLR